MTKELGEAKDMFRDGREDKKEHQAKSFRRAR